MNKLILVLTLCSMSILACAQGRASEKNTKVEWTNVGNISEGPDAGYYKQRFTVTGDTKFNKLAFNQFARSMKTAGEGVEISEIVPGYYEISYPESWMGKDSIVLEVLTRGVMTSICYAPDGVHRVNPDGRPEGVEFVNKGIIERPEQWSTPKRDLMPKAETIYALNSRLQSEASSYKANPLRAYGMIPSIKGLKPTGKTTDGTKLKYNYKIDNTLGDTIKIEVKGKEMTVRGSSSPLMQNRARQLFEMLSKEKTVPEAEATDYPDYEYRGVMLDIARNYQTPAEMRRMIDQMAKYGFNTLHFHLGDDEAWRLEIPGLPELTKVGGRRGYTKDEKENLAQIFCGDGNPDNFGNTSNGWFSRQDFVEFLKYADSKGIRVLPEIESPGHARAAIISMRNRARHTGDESFLLTEEGDTSRYTSAQSFHDNVMNPSLPGPYKFMAAVVDGIAEMYAEAGVELPAIHIGGDEVPRNAWGGSPSAQAFMKEKGMKSEKELHAYFVKKVNEYMTSKGIKMSGWSEIAVGHSDEYDKEVSPNIFSVNCWHNYSDKPESEARQTLRRGYPVVISNVDFFYLDQCYNSHPMERGLTWGGLVDEYKTLSGTRDKFVKVSEGDKGRIIGLSGQLFAETIRNAQGFETLLFPKMLGLAERAWNADSTYSDGAFASIVSEKEIPSWSAEGITWHVGQPGIYKEKDGKVSMNAPYIGVGEIRYTLDGSEPTENSILYKGSFTIPEGSKEIRAAYIIDGKRSMTTILR